MTSMTTITTNDFTPTPTPGPGQGQRPYSTLPARQNMPVAMPYQHGNLARTPSYGSSVNPASPVIESASSQYSASDTGHGEDWRTKRYSTATNMTFGPISNKRDGMESLLEHDRVGVLFPLQGACIKLTFSHLHLLPLLLIILNQRRWPVHPHQTPRQLTGKPLNLRRSACMKKLEIGRRLHSFSLAQVWLKSVWMPLRSTIHLNRKAKLWLLLRWVQRVNRHQMPPHLYQLELVLPRVDRHWSTHIRPLLRLTCRQQRRRSFKDSDTRTPNDEQERAGNLLDNVISLHNPQVLLFLPPPIPQIGKKPSRVPRVQRT